MIRVDIWLPDPASILATGAFGTGALIRLERAATIGGVYSEVTTIPVVATTLQYTYWDAAGSASSWYRWRVSNAGNSSQSDYSDPFAGTNPAATVFPTSYAPLSRLLGMFSTAPTQPRKIARLAELLGVATQQLIEACGGRDYFAHPNTGIATPWTLSFGPVRRDRNHILHAHDGIVSIDSLEASDDRGSTFSAIAGGDYVLRGEDPYSDAAIPDGEPAFHVVLTGYGTRTFFPWGTNVIRPTGIRGWPAVPETLIEATAQRARQLAWAEGSFSGSQAGGMDEFGSPAPTDRFWPQSTYNFIARQASRFNGCRA